MRIISGKYKGKKLFSPSGNLVRPTADRIKETMFNILAHMDAVDGKVVLDLFCGSGALGLEALSRGAKNAMFIDKSQDSVKLTLKNLAHVNEKQEVFNADFCVAIKKLQGKKFDLIFADPPYAQGLEQSIIECILRYDILADDGVIVLEHSKENSLQNFENQFIINTRSCGVTAITILKKQTEE